MRGVVHEIRNHLAVAIANVEAFRDGILEPTSARLGAVLQALAEIEVLLTEIPRTTPALERRAENTAIDVSDIISIELAALEDVAKERGIGFTCAPATRDEPGGPFEGDPVRIAELVGHVVANAIRYMPRGGRITVEQRRARTLFYLSAVCQGPDEAETDRLARIFAGAFSNDATLKADGEGIGIALMRRFVEERGGTLELETVAGRGPRLTVRLPKVASATP